MFPRYAEHSENNSRRGQKIPRQELRDERKEIYERLRNARYREDRVHRKAGAGVRSARRDSRADRGVPVHVGYPYGMGGRDRRPSRYDTRSRVGRRRPRGRQSR